jgi:hypothetical protein
MERYLFLRSNLDACKISDTLVVDVRTATKKLQSLLFTLYSENKNCKTRSIVFSIRARCQGPHPDFVGARPRIWAPLHHHVVACMA